MKQLERLVETGAIKSYKIENVSDEGEVGKMSKCRNTQQLEIMFPNGEYLLIGTFCSGCLEDTTFTDLDEES